MVGCPFCSQRIIWPTASPYFGKVHLALKNRQPHGRCPSIPTVVSSDAATARQGAAWFVAFYLTMMGPLYQKALVRMGFKKEVEAVLAANEGQKPAVVPPEAESLLEQLTIYGPPAQARQQLDGWYEAGAELPGLVLGPNLSPEAIDFTLQAFRSSTA
jgi:alkanesulfonate monooxygenase SsuD/methylene tetrahydromethanopterin reductase-like flavin-dependent oxidoreductase (luciferase family)